MTQERSRYFCSIDAQVLRRNQATAQGSFACTATPVIILTGGINMGLTHVTVALRSLGSLAGTYEDDFLVDTGATDCVAPASKLKQIDVNPVGSMVYEVADGSKQEYPFGLVEIRFMGEITAGRVVFGPDEVEPLLGVTALESVGITVDPANHTLKRLPAIPLKKGRRSA